MKTVKRGMLKITYENFPVEYLIQCVCSIDLFMIFVLYKGNLVHIFKNMKFGIKQAGVNFIFCSSPVSKLHNFFRLKSPHMCTPNGNNST